MDRPPDFRHQASFGLILAALVILTPFILDHFRNGRYGLGLGVTMVLVLFGFHHWQIRQERRKQWMISLAYLIVMLVFVLMALRGQGHSAVFWCYPAVLTVYFIMPELQARMANLLLLATVLPEAHRMFPTDWFLRVAASLVAVSFFSAFCTRVIDRQQRELHFMATHDPLTGLLNRTSLERSLSKALAQTSSSSLICLDLDHFKSLNDNYGHDAGDAVLEE